MGAGRFRLVLGPAAGGLLAAAALPMAVAVADDASDSSVFDPLLRDFFGFARDTSQPATVYSVSGEPPIFQSVHQTELFSTASGGAPAGSFQVDDEVITSAFGPASAELLVTGSETGTGAPPVGSVYDVIDFGAGFENFYSDVAPTTPGGPDTLSDTLVTPLGDIPVATRLHAFLDPSDAFFGYRTPNPPAALSDSSTTGSSDDTTAASSFFNPFFRQFFGFDHDASKPTTVTDIAAIPPFYQSVHQTVFFDTAPTGTLPGGWFQAGNNVLANAAGPGFSELVVTDSEKDTSAPPTGSVYEINNIGNGFENVYSDVAPTTPGGTDTLSDVLVTPFGNIPVMVDLHAFFPPAYSFFLYHPTDPPTPPAAPFTGAAPADATAFDPGQPFAFFGFEHDATEPTTLTAVSGLTGVAGTLPAADSLFNSVHLNESFDTGASGALPAGSFQADGNLITTATGLSNAEILVTGSENGANAPPVGSVYDVIDIGRGFENFYSDVAPTTAGGTDTISDTLVTPFGDIPLLTDFHAFSDPADSFFPF